MFYDSELRKYDSFSKSSIELGSGKGYFKVTFFIPSWNIDRYVKSCTEYVLIY